MTDPLGQYQSNGSGQLDRFPNPQESAWLEKETQQRLTYYPRWKTWDEKNYKHYYVHGHDNYYDIIAASFEEVIIPKEEAGDLIFLIEEY